MIGDVPGLTEEVCRGPTDPQATVDGGERLHRPLQRTTTSVLRPGPSPRTPRRRQTELERRAEDLARPAPQPPQPLFIFVHDHAACAMTITGAHPVPLMNPDLARSWECDLVEELGGPVGLLLVDLQLDDQSVHGAPLLAHRTKPRWSGPPIMGHGGRRRGRSGPGSYPPTRQIGISLLVKRCSRSCSVGPTAGVALRHQAGQPGAVASIWTTSANSASRDPALELPGDLHHDPKPER